MPYYIDNTNDGDCIFEWDFVPKIPMSSKRPFLNGWGISEQDIESFPKQIVVYDLDDINSLPDIFANGARPGIVRREIKEVLERLDPGIHKYFGIDVCVGEQEVKGDYYLIYTENKIGSVCYEKSKFHRGYGKEVAESSLFRPAKDLEGNVEVKLYKNKVNGSHLWRGLDEENALVFFCSDEFGDYLKSLDVKGWDLSRCEWVE